MFTKFISSRVVAFVAGAFACYCAGVGDYDGAITVIFAWSLLAWDYRTKKGTTAANSRTQK